MEHLRPVDALTERLREQKRRKAEHYRLIEAERRFWKAHLEVERYCLEHGATLDDDHFALFLAGRFPFSEEWERLTQRYEQEFERCQELRGRLKASEVRRGILRDGWEKLGGCVLPAKEQVLEGWSEGF